MKTVLFCGGQGMRIREYSEAVPKPMIPIGHQPILWHLMSYYAGYGHKDFVLCLGYKANVVKEFFLSGRPQTFSDCVVSGFGSKVEILGDARQDWRVALIDTGISRNIGGRLMAVRHHVENEQMFFANYSDGLSDVDINKMVETFVRSGKIACFLAVRPTTSMHLISIGDKGQPTSFRSAKDADLWINGGFFIMRPEIFDYMRPGEELVSEPFTRLIAEDKLLAYKHEGFWCPMDTLRDRNYLEELVDRGDMPWLAHAETASSEARRA
ncbi:MAG: sugar phosphate nucleotidyltransferase [Hyphomicrobiaceae bacterium]|nr:sugar phosphate nucleotidyltransferase [Hyphomicrobiaceae bacterium]